MTESKYKQISRNHGQLLCIAPECLVRKSREIRVGDEVESKTSSSQRYKIYHAECYDAMFVG